MSRSASYAFTLCLVGVVTVGCQNVGDYFEDRGKDFTDIVSLELYWGQGIVANARMTKVAQMGVGAFDGDILKYSRRAFGVVEEARAEAGVPFYYFTAYDRQVLRGNEEFLARHEDPAHLARLGVAQYNLTDSDDRGFYEFGGSAAFFVGLGLGVDLLQILDFTTGWFLVDIGRDDIRNSGRDDVSNPRFEPIGDTPISGASAGG